MPPTPAPAPARPAWLQRLRLPLVAAPMLRVSGVDLVAAACAAGVVGAFPTANARSTAELDTWLGTLRRRLAGQPQAAPWCANLIMRSPRLADDLACLLRHGPELVITSVGSPAPVLPALQGMGCSVLADVATLAHAHKAINAGVDGLVLLSAGAGGQTGWLNPLAFVRALRREGYGGLIALAGGISDGVALRAACVLGADLGYAGTRFIATHESLAEPDYQQMLVAASADDVLLTRAFTGLPTSMLAPSIRRAGLDPARLDETVTPETAAQMFGGRAHPQDPPGDAPRRWRDVWSAGHSVSGVHALPSVADLIAELAAEYHDASA
ncbi:NAD(P)H-dependent flavin oxidoreductase [Aquabacterium sp. OR-4]|uniref:NAD(P)H-dependent flavin oxidoreductase n=1 Tax=Aquabacterium sp. OR-4 TaxID=2978127 RepID=UPI0021B45B50|nr:nitronate monooxygenase [Aquabacterium sp. OR-4]MDT7835740.1 nitronate monooxygenase [Aquabacterium sp. OR-4]